MANFTIVCGACEREPVVVPNDEGAMQAVCAGCGIRDNIEDAQRIAGEHFVQQAMPGIQSGLAGAVKNKLHLKFKPHRIPQRSFRWHAVAK